MNERHENESDVDTY
jgi:hypothetical protein